MLIKSNSGGTDRAIDQICKCEKISFLRGDDGLRGNLQPNGMDLVFLRVAAVYFSLRRYLSQCFASLSFLFKQELRCES